MPPFNAMDESNRKARNWVFTLNNYTDADIDYLRAYSRDKCHYIVFAKEVGKTGTPHLQGYMQLKQQTLGDSVKRQSKVKKMWMGVANGSAQKNREYCTKQYQESDDDEQNAIEAGDIVELGEMVDANAGRAKGGASGKGAAATKAMWKGLDDDIKTGMTEKEIKSKYPHLYFKHHAGISRGVTLENAVPTRKGKTCVHVYVGPPGVGKTHSALEYCRRYGEPFEYSSPNRIWWTGYNGTQPVLFDDFRGEYPFGEWKKLTDQYPHKVPVHNGMQNFASRLLCITSNHHPTDWWKPEVFGTHGHAAMFRRINVLMEWSSELESFVPAELPDIPSRKLWNEGCCCETKVELTRTGTLIIPESPVASQEEPQHIQPILHMSSFLDEEQIPQRKRKSQPTAKNPKKPKVSSPSKKVGDLTKKMNELYPDAVQVKHKPLRLKGDSQDDPIDSFSSSSSSDSMEEELESISEDLE